MTGLLYLASKEPVIPLYDISELMNLLILMLAEAAIVLGIVVL